MNIWLKLNSISNNKLGIIRDFDNQENAQILHEKYNKFSNICVRTTKEYTLEPEIVNTGKNYNILIEKYGEVFGWKSLSYNELANSWQSSKSNVMLQICKDLSYGELKEFQMPTHIQEVIDFLMAKKESHGN